MLRGPCSSCDGPDEAFCRHVQHAKPLGLRTGPHRYLGRYKLKKGPIPGSRGKSALRANLQTTLQSGGPIIRRTNAILRRRKKRLGRRKAFYLFIHTIINLRLLTLPNK
jgi:hypothetical protein